MSDEDQQQSERLTRYFAFYRLEDQLTKVPLWIKKYGSGGGNNSSKARDECSEEEGFDLCTTMSGARFDKEAALGKDDQQHAGFSTMWSILEDKFGPESAVTAKSQPLVKRKNKAHPLVEHPHLRLVFFSFLNIDHLFNQLRPTCLSIDKNVQQHILEVSVEFLAYMMIEPFYAEPPPRPMKLKTLLRLQAGLTQEATVARKKRVIDYYGRHNTEKLLEVDTVIAAFNGDDAKLFARLLEKYGPETFEPSPTPASMTPEEIAFLEAKKAAFRKRLVAFYEYHCPESTKHVDLDVYFYARWEDELFAALIAKFGPEPPNLARVTPDGCKVALIPFDLGRRSLTALSVLTHHHTAFLNRIVNRLGLEEKNLENLTLVDPDGHDDEVIESNSPGWAPEHACPDAVRFIILQFPNPPRSALASNKRVAPFELGFRHFLVSSVAPSSETPAGVRTQVNALRHGGHVAHAVVYFSRSFERIGGPILGGENFFQPRTLSLNLLGTESIHATAQQAHSLNTFGMFSPSSLVTLDLRGLPGLKHLYSVGDKGLSPEDTKTRLVQYYSDRCPPGEKKTEAAVNAAISEFHGQYDIMWEKLVEKYGVESAAPSTEVAPSTLKTIHFHSTGDNEEDEEDEDGGDLAIEVLGPEFFSQSCAKHFSLEKFTQLRRVPDCFLNSRETLVHVDLSSPSLTEIGDHVLTCCANLRSVSLAGASALEKIGSNFLLNCRLLRTFTFPVDGSALTVLGGDMLSRCPQLGMLDMSSVPNIRKIPAKFAACFSPALTNMVVEKGEDAPTVRLRLLDLSPLTTARVCSEMGENEYTSWRRWLKTQGTEVQLNSAQEASIRREQEQWRTSAHVDPLKGVENVHRERLLLFYNVVKENKDSETIETILQEWEGDEENLMVTLAEKYDLTSGQLDLVFAPPADAKAKAALRHFYDLLLEHKSDPQLDAILSQWVGKLPAMYEALDKKYGLPPHRRHHPKQASPSRPHHRCSTRKGQLRARYQRAGVEKTDAELEKTLQIWQGRDQAMYAAIEKKYGGGSSGPHAAREDLNKRYLAYGVQRTDVELDRLLETWEGRMPALYDTMEEKYGYQRSWDRLRATYKKLGVQKTDQEVEQTLQTFKGREDAMYQAIEKKYGRR